MKTRVKAKIKSRARISRGLLCVLKDDVENLSMAVDNFDILAINQATREINDTLQKFIDNLTELEYILYLHEHKES